MTRRDAFFRTSGYLANGYTVVLFIPLQICELYRLLKGVAETDEIIFFIISITAEFITIFIYRKYLLDIFLKNLDVCEGEIIDIKVLPGSNAQSTSKSRRYELTVLENGINKRLIFIIGKLEIIYNTNNLLQKIRNKAVKIQYLVRSKCVVEILDFSDRGIS